MSSAELLDRAGPPAPEPPPRGLWHHRDFRRLWAGQTVSLLGSRVTELALPVTAIVLLDASPAQLGLLNSAQYLPVLEAQYREQLERSKLLLEPAGAAGVAALMAGKVRVGLNDQVVCVASGGRGRSKPRTGR